MATTNTDTKVWYSSWTVLANLIGVAVILLQLILGANLIGDPEYQALALAILNILLRLRTAQALRLR